MSTARDIARLLEEQNALLRELVRYARPRRKGTSKKPPRERRASEVVPTDIDRARASRAARRLGLR
jgi:hypothetical protein